MRSHIGRQFDSKPDTRQIQTAKHHRRQRSMQSRSIREGVGFPQQGTRRRRNEDSGLTLDAAQKSAEATIRGWRKLPHYRQNVLFQRDAGAYFRQMLNPHRPME